MSKVTKKGPKIRSWKLTFNGHTQLFIGVKAPILEEVPHIDGIRGLKLSQVIIDESNG